MFLLFFFNDTATTEIYTLSLHDALPISFPAAAQSSRFRPNDRCFPSKRRPGSRRRSLFRSRWWAPGARPFRHRSEEHTSELQSPCNLVCRLLLEKKKTAAAPTTYFLPNP